VQRYRAAGKRQVGAGKVLASRQTRRRWRVMRQAQFAGRAGGDFHGAIVAAEYAGERLCACNIENLGYGEIGVVEIEVQTPVNFCG